MHSLTVIALLVSFLCGILSQVPQEVMDSGRTQYALLQEKVNLPQYGSCWKQAVQHIHEGCNALSEETQSDIALHLTNCFLQMSGHETYKCEMDKKPNLRGICINSMTDRAFNVYTEFYTHTQNICWFLRGQVWQETIAENTMLLGRQLEISALNQEELLKRQKESVAVQEKLLEHGRLLENVVGAVTESVSQSHSKILGLQNWLITEMSWIDTVIFYTISIVFLFILTTAPSASASRLPVLFLFCANVFLEKLVYNFIISRFNDQNAADIKNLILKYVWCLRYSLVFLSAAIVILNMYFYKDYAKTNNRLLAKIYQQNLEVLEKINNRSHKNNLDANGLNHSIIISEKSFNNSFKHKEVEHSFSHSKIIDESFNHIHKSPLPYVHSNLSDKLFDEFSPRYNLRSRQGTLDSVASTAARRERLKKPMKNGNLYKNSNGNINKVTSP